MARFPEEWLAELIEKNDIVDVISQYIPLKRQGMRYWAKCPWHSERNASFSVQPAKQMYYCFSCKKGGGVINFMMEYEKLTYVEAVERLAERAGMELPQTKFSAQDQEREKRRREYKKRLHELMRSAALMYHEILRSPEGEPARRYLANRGVLQSAAKFGLGYAPDRYDTAIKALTAKGYSVKELADAGLVRQKNNHAYDVFRGRVLFPVQDVRGNVVAFGGRVLGDGEPKYLNSPETLIFNKRENLYALNMVKKRQGLSEITLVEGYMDVVSIAAAGYDTAVAALGTAFTSGQARLLKRYASSVAVMLDSDRAGITAAQKVCSILEKERLEVKVVLLEDGMDPDEYVKKYGLDALQRRVREGITPTELRLRTLKEDFNMQIEQDRVRYSTKACEIIGKLDNEIEKDRYYARVARETGISAQTLSAQANRGDGNNSLLNVVKLKDNGSAVDDETKLLSAVIERPELAEKLGILESDFTQEKQRNVFSEILRQIKKGKTPTNGEIINMLAEEDELKHKLARVSTRSDLEDFAFSLLMKLRIDALERQKLNILQKIDKEENKEEWARLMLELKPIDDKIKDIKRQRIERLRR